MINSLDDCTSAQSEQGSKSRLFSLSTNADTADKAEIVFML